MLHAAVGARRRYFPHRAGYPRSGCFRAASRSSVFCLPLAIRGCHRTDGPACPWPGKRNLIRHSRQSQPR
jgi:hypothetical protein